MYRYILAAIVCLCFAISAGVRDNSLSAQAHDSSTEQLANSNNATKAPSTKSFIPSIAGKWHGIAQGNEPSLQGDVDIQQDGETVEGSVITKSFGGETKRYLRGFYDPKLSVFVCKDIGFNYIRNAPGWMHCLVDRYELGLVDGGEHLAGNYISTACRDRGYFLLERRQVAEHSAPRTVPPSEDIAQFASVKKLEPREIALRAFKSTVVVDADKQGEIWQGSGFIVEKSLVITNYHVIKDATVIRIKLVGEPIEYPIKKVVTVDKLNDLAVLLCPSLEAPALSLGNSTNIAIGESVYAIGNPKGLEGTFSDGLLSGIRNEDGKRILQTTAPFSPGSSGGPLLDNTAAVIGITKEISTEGQNLNFAVPVEYIKQLISTNNLTESDVPKFVCITQPYAPGQPLQGTEQSSVNLPLLDPTFFPVYRLDKAMPLEWLGKDTFPNNLYKTPSGLTGSWKSNEAINIYSKNEKDTKAGFSSRHNCGDEVSPGTSFNRQDQIYQQFENGLQSQKASHYIEACQYYEQVLQFAPNMFEAQFNLGVSLLKCDRKDDAIKHLETAAQINPNDYDTQYLLGTALLQCEKQEQAIKYLERAIQIKPSDGDTQCLLGIAFMLCHKQETALKHLETAVQINPNDSKAQEILGSIFLDLGNLNKAKEHLQLAESSEPNDAKIRVNLGLVFMKLGTVNQAEQQFEAAIKLDPNCAGAWLDLGSLKMETGDLAAAIKYFKEYVSRFPLEKDTALVQRRISYLEKEWTHGNQNGNNLNSKDYFAEAVEATSKGTTVRWPQQRMPLRVFIHSGNGVKGYQPMYDQILQRSFQTWENASQGRLRFTFVRVNDDRVDIHCNWTDNPHSMRNAIGEGGETIVEAFGRDIVSAAMKILTSDSEVADERASFLTGPELSLVCLHEIGHASGIAGHSPNPKDVMYLSDSVFQDNPILSPRDTATLIRIYTSP